MDQARDAVAKGGDHDDQPDAVLHEPVRATVATISPATASARLRAAREALGMTTADIAARTRITQRHVNALDRGDLAALPGRPYVIGFVRSYARVVGLDETVLAALVRSELDAGAPKPAPRVVLQYDVEDPAKTPSRLLTWLALVLFVVVLAAGGVFWRSYYAPGADLPSLALPDPTQSAAPPPAAVASTPANGPVVFTARDDGIWIKFYDGHGQQLLQKVLTRGESYTVPSDAFEPKVWTARPEALEIKIGGRIVPPLSDHRGVLRDIPVTAQALLARPAPQAASAQAGQGNAAVAPAIGRPHPPRRHAARGDTGDAIGLAPLTPPPAADPVAAPAAAPATAATPGVQ
jgi:transcriptional regulator with XRE-family HTH domain